MRTTLWRLGEGELIRTSSLKPSDCLVRGDFKFKICTLRVPSKVSRKAILHIIEEKDFKIDLATISWHEIETLTQKQYAKYRRYTLNLQKFPRETP